MNSLIHPVAISNARPELTVHRIAKLTIWWLVVSVEGILAIVLGAVIGAIAGAGRGIVDGIRRTRDDARDLFGWVER
jgi:hypothetical protein